MKNNSTKILVIILIAVIIIAGSILAIKIFSNKKTNQEEAVALETPEENTNTNKEEKPIQIYNGNDRPIAVMIDNHSGAWPQGGLNDTYMVYEIIVEGGETRLMALFKGANVEKIGPVRSSRHYFLDYALENDAIYVHYGWSPQAEKDITRYSVNNINGISESSSSFWRVKDKSSPHNVATSTEQILKIAERKKYKTTSTAKSVLNYSADEINLGEEKQEETQNETTQNSSVLNAINVTIPHSNLQTVKYEYDSENKVYTRYARKKLQKEWSTGKAITTKNIIIEFIDNTDLNDGENKGRQNLNNIGTFDGYYITNGKAIKIKCTKTARDEKTVYKDLEGNEIKVNDGNTWVNICPKDADVKITE